MISALAPAWQYQTVESLGFEPLVLDVDEVTGLLTAEIVSKGMQEGGRLLVLHETEGILPDFEGIMSLGIPVIEDISQSAGASVPVLSPEGVPTEERKLAGSFGIYTIMGLEERDVLTATLRRVVAMFRLVQTTPLPAKVARLKFYYTGGSSTLSAVTGYGSVNSKQTVILDVAAGQTQFDVYTIPHAETGSLRMTISALDASETVLKERVFEEVPVQRNRITRYTGDLFDGSSAETGENTFHMKAEAEWGGEDEQDF